MRYTALPALAAALLAASPAFAGTADTATAEARGTVLQPLTITRLSDLDFGWVVSTANAGTVSIDPDSGTRSTTGGVTAVANYPGNRAKFAGAGTVGNAVLLTLTQPGVLVSQTNPADTVGASLTLDNGGATTRYVGTSSTFLVGVGGDFNIAANQPNGVYTANFDLTADYQ